MQFDPGEYVDVDLLKQYLLDRRNPDGGFCYYSLDESSLNDTFYAVMILEKLGSMPEDDRTVEFLRAFQHEDGSFYSIFSAWCVLRGLKALGKKPKYDPSGYVLGLLGSFEIKDSVFMESLSIFESGYYIADMLALVGRRDLCGGVADKVLATWQKTGQSGLTTAYHALSIAAMAGPISDEYREEAAYIKKCESDLGGFSKKPGNGIAFMDETYYGLNLLELLGERPFYVAEDIRFVADCQNANGGFRRARASGISMFYSSYYALESLELLSRQKV
jgi:hypothetical protein